MNIPRTNCLRFIFAIQSICCTLLPTSYVFLLSNIGFPNLSQGAYFFRVTCIHGTIKFSENSGLMIEEEWIQYGRMFIFLIL